MAGFAVLFFVEFANAFRLKLQARYTILMIRAILSEQLR